MSYFAIKHKNVLQSFVDVLGPDYMEAGRPGRQAGSFAEIRIRLILYSKNCLGKRAHKPECAYVISTWQVTRKELWKEFLCLLT